MARQYNEAKEQKALISWVSLYPRLRPYIFAIPNGGKRDAWEAAHLKAQGVTSGISDLFLFLPAGKFHGLFIEMKSGAGKATDNQKGFMQRASDVGYDVCIAHSWVEAKDKIVSYLQGSPYQGMVNVTESTPVARPRVAANFK